MFGMTVFIIIFCYENSFLISAFAFFQCAPQKVLSHGQLPSRDFYLPQNDLSWNELAQELAKDKAKKTINSFKYTKGTKSFDGKITTVGFFSLH